MSFLKSKIYSEPIIKKIHNSQKKNKKIVVMDGNLPSDSERNEKEENLLLSGIFVSKDENKALKFEDSSTNKKTATKNQEENKNKTFNTREERKENKHPSYYIDLNDDLPTCRICHCTENACESISDDNSYETSSNSDQNLNFRSSSLATGEGSPTNVKKALSIAINVPPGSSSPNHAIEQYYPNTNNQISTCNNAIINSNIINKVDSVKDKDTKHSLSNKNNDQLSNKLISPCHCSGSLKWVHHNCLQQWLSATNSQRCELCKYQFSMTVKYKPIYQWKALNASPSDRRRLICNSVLNLILMICVFWSTYVLIERASSDARYGQIDWAFWTKMCVITIGFIGGVIFLFVQLRLYLSIFIRWRQSNRIIIIRNVDRDQTGANATSLGENSKKSITANQINNSNQNSNNSNLSTNIDVTPSSYNLTNISTTVCGSQLNEIPSSSTNNLPTTAAAPPIEKKSSTNTTTTSTNTATFTNATNNDTNKIYDVDNDSDDHNMECIA